MRRNKSQWRTFSRCWQRALPVSATLMLGLTPGLQTAAHAVTAFPTAYYQSGSDGNYSTFGNFKTSPAGGTTVVPDSADGTFYMVVNTTGSAITHDHSTGPSGVDTISGLNTNGSFYLTGGTLAGNAAGAGFSVTGTGSVFQIGNATLRNFTVSGSPTTITGASTLDTDVFQSGLNLVGTSARIINTLSLTNNAVASISAGGTLSANYGTTGAVTLSGPVQFTDGNGNNSLSVENATTLTLASGSLVHGVNGSIGVAAFTGGRGSLVNNGTISSDGGGTISLDSALTSVASNGALQAANGGTLNSSPNVTGSGTISTDKTSTINFNGGSSLNQQGGTSQVDGAVTLNGTFTVSSGTLEGTGTLNGNVVNNGGTVKPGDSPGTLTVNGNYAQNNGVLNIEFTNAAHSLLNVTGTASTGGMVNFSFLDTTVGLGTVGETFDFLASTGLSTSLTNPLFTQYFSNEAVGGLVTEAGPGGGVFRIAQDPANSNNLQVTVVAVAPAPEPSQWAAFGVGLLGLGALALKAKRRMVA